MTPGLRAGSPSPLLSWISLGIGRWFRPLLLVTLGPLEQRSDVEHRLVDACGEVSDVGEAGGHRRDGEVVRLAVVDLAPQQRGADGADRVAAHGVRRGDG